MSLSCDCSFDNETFYVIEDVERVAQTDYKCYGCCKQGHAGDHVRRYTDARYPDEDECCALGLDPDDDLDGDIITMKYRRICEECGDLFDSLTDLGFCIGADWGFIKEAHHDYVAEYVPMVKRRKEILREAKLEIELCEPTIESMNRLKEVLSK